MGSAHASAERGLLGGSRRFSGGVRVRALLLATLGLIALGALSALVRFGLVEVERVRETGGTLPAAPVLRAEGPAVGSEKAAAAAAYASLPLSFIANRGQADARAWYTAHGAGFAFFFGKREIALSFQKGKRGQALFLSFPGGRPDVRLEGERMLPGKVNYLVGKELSAWKSVPSYGALVYRGLWPGIDLRLRGRAEMLKYEFLVRPGAKISDIRLAYRGAEGLSLAGGGTLGIRTPLGTLTDASPVSYQLAGGRRVPVQSRYVLRGSREYGFALGAYDPALPLIIDPGLAYSTFLGGTNGETGQAIAVDRAGSAYVTGITSSDDYPTTAGAYDTTRDGSDAFVTKLNPAGSALVYSTFLGGTAGEIGHDIAVDRSGNAYVTGSTTSEDFPTTAGAYDPSDNTADDAFVTKLNAAGSALVYSTYLGGTNVDFGRSIALGGAGSAYVTGITSSDDYPTTAGAYDTTRDGSDAFVTKLNPAGSALAYSTFLGGTSEEQGFGIAVDGAGRAHVTGFTLSLDHPTTARAFDPSFNGNLDAFVTKLNPAGSALVYSTYLGGTSGEQGYGIALGGAGSAYVTGDTSSPEFPTTPRAYDRTHNILDAFVTKLNPAGSALAYSTFLGGSSGDIGYGIAVDGAGNAYVTGDTASPDYPTTPGAHDMSPNGGDDAFVTRLNAAGSALFHSTYLGGTDQDFGYSIAVDGAGGAYITGETFSPDYPTTPGAYDQTYNGGFSDAFVTKVDTRRAP
jgi:hypothetical protein